MLEIYHVHLDDKRTIVDYLDPWAVMRIAPFADPDIKQCAVTLYPQEGMGVRLTIHGDARTIARNVALSKLSPQLIVCPNGKW